MTKILLLEDDEQIAQSVCTSFACRFSLEHVATVACAKDRLAVSDYDLLVLDLGLPDGSGIDVLKSYRSKGGLAPAIFLTAKSDINDKLTGFDAGGDDYLTKPFHIRELEVRVNALLKRPRDIIEKALVLGDLRLNQHTLQVAVGGRQVRLLPKEFSLLQFLMRHAGQVFTQEVLLERVWPTDSESSTETVTTTIKRLRKKIDSPGQPSHIENTFGVGYKIVATVSGETQSSDNHLQLN